MSLPFDMPPGLTPEVQEELIRWDEERQKVVAQIKKIPLRVLVWGPSAASPNPVAAKRVQIRDALVADGFAAVFSEIWANAEPSLSQKTNELTQALTAHLIIILIENSPGALAEMHDFSNHPDIVRIMYVMCPRRYESGYSAQGTGRILDLAYGNVYWYEDNEIPDCKVLKRALERANALREDVANKKLRGVRH